MKTHRKLLCLLVAGLCLGPAILGRADLKATKIGDSLVDAEALTIQGAFGRCINGLAFQQDAVVTHRDYQYVGYYDGKRRVCLARRRLPKGPWQVIRFGDYDFRSNDAHNTISLGICPGDGTIHLSFDHHGSPLHYRVSRKGAATRPGEVPWDASLFGPVVSELEPGKRLTRVTYPRFWPTPEGKLQFCYRVGSSGNGDRVLVDYDPQTGTWGDWRRIDSGAGVFEDAQGSSPSRCSYPNGYDYGPLGRLHVTWVWRERTQGANHDIMYACSEDRGKTWLSSRGDVVGTWAPGKGDGKTVRVDSPGITVIKIPRTLGLLNTQAQAVDPEGRIHVVMWHCTDQTLAAAGGKRTRWGPPAARRHHHYWRDHDGTWHHTELPGVPGNRPKLFIDRQGNAYLVFNAKRAADYLAGPDSFRGGDLTIAAATAASGWKDWKVIHREKGPLLNETLGDNCRWKSQGVLSVLVQEWTDKLHGASALRILDFSLEGDKRQARQDSRVH